MSMSDQSTQKNTTKPTWQRAEILLILLAVGSPLAFASWMTLLNNFAVDEVNFTGVEIGILQSLREIPGFLTFTVVFVLLAIKEQPFAIAALSLLGIGTAITGFFPTVYGLYFTTILMSIGFHYFESLHQSLSLQWLDKKIAPEALGRILAFSTFASLISFGVIYFSASVFELSLKTLYMMGGGSAVVIALICWICFPRMETKVEQHKHLVIKKDYWLFYALQFMSGARRQIFVVFAGFLMVERFDFDVPSMALLFLANGILTMFTAPYIGKLIGKWGERKILIIEYVGLILVFTGYAFVTAAWAGIALYILDHLFFSIAIALKTYFQKIADPADIASTSGVSFTISHIAAVVLPVAYGFLWVISPSAVFLSGAALAGVSLYLALLVPRHPSRNNVARANPFRSSRKDSIKEN